MISNLFWVLLGSMLIGAGAAAVGSFAYLRKQALVGDAIAHSILPGVVLAFLLVGYKSMWALLLGALVAGWISIWIIDTIQRTTRIKPDTAIAMVLSVFFAIGLVLMSNVQRTGKGQQAGLDAFLFGKAAAMMPSDIYLFLSIDAVFAIVIWALYPYLKLLSFDKSMAMSIGLPVRFLEFVLSTLTVLAVATGLQAVGVVLMAAMLIIPAAVARFYVKRLSQMLLFASILGMTSALVGGLISYTAPMMPTGPWIVIVLSISAMISFIFAPKKGVLISYILRIRHRQKMREENILKELYKFSEKGDSNHVTRIQLAERRRFDGARFESSLSRLKEKGFIEIQSDRLSFTKVGLHEAARVVRLHRLWELYLTERMNLAIDHVHNDADAIEHIISPDLEAALIAELGFPQVDPHDSHIPGISPPK